jgi:hypothetical protein
MKRAQQAGQLALGELAPWSVIVGAAPVMPQTIIQADQRLDQL